MPRSPQVNFRLKPHDAEGLSLIYLQFLYNKYRLFFSFGQKVNVSNWNKNKQRVKNTRETSSDGKYLLNDLLENLEKVCIKAYNNEIKNGIPHPDTLKRYLEDFLNQNEPQTQQEMPSLFKLLDRFINNEIKFKGKNKSKNTLKTYNTLKGHLHEYQHIFKHKVDFDTVNLEFFYKYVDFLGKRNRYEKQIRSLRPELKNKMVGKIGTNAISKDIQILKTVMGEAVDLDYTTNYAFKHKKFFVTRTDTDAVYLKDKELQDLYKYDLSKNKRLEQVRDLFIFGCWVGLRFSDYNNVKAENIVMIENDLFLKITPQKTSDYVIIPCNGGVLEIFKKYENSPNKLPKSISNQKFNEYIKEVCKLTGMNEKGRLSSDLNLELWECISSHTARRSFATNLYLEGYPTLEIMKITGHRTERSFMKYIKLTKLDAAKNLNLHMKKKWEEKRLKAEGSLMKVA
jgi:integrase